MMNSHARMVKLATKKRKQLIQKESNRPETQQGKWQGIYPQEGPTAIPKGGPG